MRLTHERFRADVKNLAETIRKYREKWAKEARHETQCGDAATKSVGVIASNAATSQGDVPAGARLALLRRSAQERYKAGRALREATPREHLANCAIGDRDPVAILTGGDRGLIQALLPIRIDRMAASPLAFFRSAIALMVQDFAIQPQVGVLVQACGDGQLMNFGSAIGADGNLYFDVANFDETCPGVDFTFDVKRLCASFAVGVLAGGGDYKQASKLAYRAAQAYRLRVSALATLSPLDAYRRRVDLQSEARKFGIEKEKGFRRLLTNNAERQVVNIERVLGDWRIQDHPPLIYHVRDADNAKVGIDPGLFLTAYRDALPQDKRALLEPYTLRDVAFKVTGIGSVGLFCAIYLLMTGSDETLFLEIREARRPALELISRADAMPRGDGRRIVEGRRLIQGDRDPFLGWTSHDQSGREFHFHTLSSRQLAPLDTLLVSKEAQFYAHLCGSALAHAHARTGDAPGISGYLGKSETADDAFARFAIDYAAQTEKDFKRFIHRAQVPGARELLIPLDWDDSARACRHVLGQRLVMRVRRQPRGPGGPELHASSIRYFAPPLSPLATRASVSIQGCVANFHRGPRKAWDDELVYPASAENCCIGRNLPVVRVWPLRIMCMSSMPAIVDAADRNDLNPSIGRATRLTARWSCSTMLLPGMCKLDTPIRVSRGPLIE